MMSRAWNADMQQSSPMIWADAFVDWGFFADEGLSIDFRWQSFSLRLLSFSASFAACAETLTALIFAWQRIQKMTLFFSLAGVFFHRNFPSFVKSLRAITWSSSTGFWNWRYSAQNRWAEMLQLMQINICEVSLPTERHRRLAAQWKMNHRSYPVRCLTSKTVERLLFGLPLPPL